MALSQVQISEQEFSENSALFHEIQFPSPRFQFNETDRQSIETKIVHYFG